MRVLVTGDFFPGGRLRKLSKANPSEVFGEFAENIRTADLSITNLEAPLCGSLKPIQKTGLPMCASPASGDFLANSRFDLVTLANNHIFDYGAPGLEETFSALDEYGISYVGAGRSAQDASRPFLKTIDGVAIAVLNFAENEWSTTRSASPGANPIDPIANFRSIQDAKLHADHVVVICHGGHEMYSLPSPRMKELFRFYVEAGANAVINHHTHCISGYEVYRGAPIFYSLGNFLFDNADRRSGTWTQGLAIELDISDKQVDFEIHSFDQCTEDSLFELHDENEQEILRREIDSLNAIINDDGKLEHSFRKFVIAQSKLYQCFLEPMNIRLLQAAQNRGLAPSLWSKTKLRVLLNLIRCEAHRDLIIEMLEQDVGNSQ